MLQSVQRLHCNEIAFGCHGRAYPKRFSCHASANLPTKPTAIQASRQLVQIRLAESQRADSLLNDPFAAALLRQVSLFWWSWHRYSMTRCSTLHMLIAGVKAILFLAKISHQALSDCSLGMGVSVLNQARRAEVHQVMPSPRASWTTACCGQCPW